MLDRVTLDSFVQAAVCFFAFVFLLPTVMLCTCVIIVAGADVILFSQV